MLTAINFDLSKWKDDKGKLITWARPGGYPVLYYTQNLENQMCPDCANKRLEDPDTCPEDMPLVADVYYEGPETECDYCGAMIESAYGNPEENEQEKESEQ